MIYLQNETVIYIIKPTCLIKTADQLNIDGTYHNGNYDENHDGKAESDCQIQY